MSKVSSMVHFPLPTACASDIIDDVEQDAIGGMIRSVDCSKWGLQSGQYQILKLLPETAQVASQSVVGLV
jgi:hypothetical protein